MFVVAPDGKTLYASGFAAGPGKGEKVNRDWPDGRIYKFSVSTTAQPELPIMRHARFQAAEFDVQLVQPA